MKASVDGILSAYTRAIPHAKNKKSKPNFLVGQVGKLTSRYQPQLSDLNDKITFCLLYLRRVRELLKHEWIVFFFSFLSSKKMAHRYPLL